MLSWLIVIEPSPFPAHTHTHTHTHTCITIKKFLVPPQIMGDAVDCESYHHCQQPHRPLDPRGYAFNITVEYLAIGSNVTVDWQHNGIQINCAEPMCDRMDASDGLHHKTVL
jgi:hypothetical protein